MALALGKTLAELDEQVSVEELALWQAYFGLEPFGPQRSDWQLALVGAAIANATNELAQAWGGKAKPLSPSDLMPFGEHSEDFAKRKREAESQKERILRMRDTMGYWVERQSNARGEA